MYEFKRAHRLEKVKSFVYANYLSKSLRVHIIDILEPSHQTWGCLCLLGILSFVLADPLYRATKGVIRRGIDNAPDIDEIIQENRDAAYEEMADLLFSVDQIDSVCDRVPGDYFLRHHPLEIRWHVNTILSQPEENRLVSVRQSKYTKNTKIFVYSDEVPHVFSQRPHCSTYAA